MAVDKNLFLYDLAVVTIMKNEAPYIKEWVEYHLLAGVDHFYIYDNEDSDAQLKVLQPYIERGLVTHIPFQGKSRQMEAYNHAVKNYKFFCRYLAWIDADEFIFPNSNCSIVEVVDEILTSFPGASGLAANIFTFGSNGQDRADYSKGVLERFTRRSSKDWTPNTENPPHLPGGSACVSTIANPRRVKMLVNPHFAIYFDNCYAINEIGNIVPQYSSFPVSTDKIAMYHYHAKSREEYEKKVHRGNADHFDNRYKMSDFENPNWDEVFDDSILKYRTARQLEAGGSVLESIAPRKQINYQRLSNALIQNLFPAMLKNPPPDFFAGKMETFLTCRALAAYLRDNLLEKNFADALEEASLRAIQKSFTRNVSMPDMRLLLVEMPNLLMLDYPVVEDIRQSCINIVQQILYIFKINYAWPYYIELQHTLDFLQTFDEYSHD